MKATATRAKKSEAVQAARRALKGPSGGRVFSDLPSMDEPRLGDMLKDPILQQLMNSDKVEPAQLRLLLDDARQRLFD
jgi:hypothetical protein